jgi:hypothetical protein
VCQIAEKQQFFAIVAKETPNTGYAREIIVAEHATLRE